MVDSKLKMTRVCTGSGYNPNPWPGTTWPSLCFCHMLILFPLQADFSLMWQSSDCHCLRTYRAFFSPAIWTEFSKLLEATVIPLKQGVTRWKCDTPITYRSQDFEAVAFSILPSRGTPQRVRYNNQDERWPLTREWVTNHSKEIKNKKFKLPHTCYEYKIGESCTLSRSNWKSWLFSLNQTSPSLAHHKIPFAFSLLRPWQAHFKHCLRMHISYNCLLREKRSIRRNEEKNGSKMMPIKGGGGLQSHRYT